MSAGRMSNLLNEIDPSLDDRKLPMLLTAKKPGSPAPTSTSVKPVPVEFRINNGRVSSAANIMAVPKLMVNLK